VNRHIGRGCRSFFKKKCDDSNRCSLDSVQFVGFQFHAYASHRDDATRDRRRSRRRKKRVENLLFVSFLFSSYSFLGRAWRYMSTKMMRSTCATQRICRGAATGPGMTMRRGGACDDGDDGDDATARGWNGFFVVDVRRAFDGVDDDDDGTGWMMMMMCATVFFKLTRWFGCVCVCVLCVTLCRCFRFAIGTAFDRRTRRRECTTTERALRLRVLKP
jgi:hypothetical protein